MAAVAFTALAEALAHVPTANALAPWLEWLTGASPTPLTATAPSTLHATGGVGGASAHAKVSSVVAAAPQSGVVTDNPVAAAALAGGVGGGSSGSGAHQSGTSAGWAAGAGAPTAPPAAVAPSPGAHPLQSRVLLVGSAVCALTAAVLMGVVGAAGANGTLAVVEDDAHKGGGSDARRLARAAEAPPQQRSQDGFAAPGGGGGSAGASAGRSLQASVWVNQTTVEYYEDFEYVTAYPGGERNLCTMMTNYTLPPQETTYACRFALPHKIQSCTRWSLRCWWTAWTCCTTYVAMGGKRGAGGGGAGGGG